MSSLITRFPSLLAPFLIARGTVAAAASKVAVSNPHEYFDVKTHQAVDIANSFSHEAIPYPARYPSINIAPWVDPSSYTAEDRLEVTQQVLSQAMSSGSFNIIGHNMSVELLDQIVTSSQQFFDQTIEEKEEHKSVGNAFAGYTPNQQEKLGSNVYKTEDTLESKGDLREIYGLIYPPKHPENIAAPSYFQNPLNDFIEQLQPIDIAMSKIFTAALSLAKGVDLPETYLHEADGSNGGALRVHRYPAMPDIYDNSTRLSPHSDFGTLTIIYGNAAGLEEIRDGRWYKVPVNKEELHITVGQVMHIWSNGLFTDNIHRVSNKAEKDRVSFGYFLAQGQTTPGQGIAPVCNDNEEPKFDVISTGKMIRRYVEAQVEGKVTI